MRPSNSHIRRNITGRPWGGTNGGASEATMSAAQRSAAMGTPREVFASIPSVWIVMRRRPLSNAEKQASSSLVFQNRRVVSIVDACTSWRMGASKGKLMVLFASRSWRASAASDAEGGIGFVSVAARKDIVWAGEWQEGTFRTTFQQTNLSSW